MARLPALIDESTEKANAPKVLREVESLMPYAASPSEKIGLSLAKANAYAMQGEDKQSCDVVDTIKDRGASTPWAEKISLMVKQCAP